MPHFTFEPMKELEYLSERMKKFVEEFPETFSVEFGKGYTPRIDVLHDEQHVYVYIELPGVDREHLNLKIVDNTLLVAGEKKPAALENQKVTLTERTFGLFNREIPLPDTVDHGSISAKLNDGVLVVTIKKNVPESAKEVNIEIN